MKQFLSKNLYNNFIAILMLIGQKCLFSMKTIDRVNYHNRLVHQWVAEMLLNVQSGFFLVRSPSSYIFNKGDINRYKALCCI